MRQEYRLIAGSFQRYKDMPDALGRLGNGTYTYLEWMIVLVWSVSMVRATSHQVHDHGWSAVPILLCSRSWRACMKDLRKGLCASSDGTRHWE